jgi:hypothetical protein
MAGAERRWLGVIPAILLLLLLLMFGPEATLESMIGLRSERIRSIGDLDAVGHANDFSSSSTPPATRRRRLQETTRPRILYIITTLAEYNTGTRNTVRGSDRLQETLIPVVAEGVDSMLAAGFEVDVYLVCHFALQPGRYDLVRAALPESVGVSVWNDATPLGYDTSKNDLTKASLENRTLHLARQHRFVIKDKLLEYDMFVNFEDDMVIKGEHVQHYMDVTQELRRLEELAPDETTLTSKEAMAAFHGTMTKEQLKRMIPGFMRVEVLLEEKTYGAQTDTGPIPIDPDGNTVDASICCHVNHTNSNRPKTPDGSQLMIWETNVKALGIRNMPKGSWLEWVVLQRGPNQGDLPPKQVIGDYWTNRHNKHYGKVPRPAPQEFKYINNQGGWMATREQLWRWHTEICPGGFLPPYEGPHYNHDGLDMRNVEWYSGGMQLSTVRHACNLQRIIPLQSFPKALLYHSANNKQRQLFEKKEEMFTKATTMLGQLNTIRKQAEQEM